MGNTRIRTRTESYDHTIAGLLSKRHDLLSDVEGLKEQIAEIRNDVRAIERSLRALGFKDDLSHMTGHQKNRVMFGRGDLLKAILEQLRESDRPLKSREIAETLLVMKGDDPNDRQSLNDLVRRVTKSLAPLRSDGRIHSTRDLDGGCLWFIEHHRR